MTTWEAPGGMLLVPAGKKRNGKPHTVLVIQVLVVTSAADARAVERANPALRFVERKGRATKGGAS